MATVPLTKRQEVALKKVTQRAIKEKGIYLPKSYQVKLAIELPKLIDQLPKRGYQLSRIEIDEDRDNGIWLVAGEEWGGFVVFIGRRLPWPIPQEFLLSFPRPDHFQKRCFRQILPLLPALKRTSKSRLAQRYDQGNLPAVAEQIEEEFSGPPRLHAHLLILMHLISPSPLSKLEAENRFKSQFKLYQQCNLLRDIQKIFGCTRIGVSVQV